MVIVACKILNLDPLRLLLMQSGTRLLFNTCDKTIIAILNFMISGGEFQPPPPPPLCMKPWRTTHAERTAVLHRKNAGTLYVSNMSSVSLSLFCFVFHYTQNRVIPTCKHIYHHVNVALEHIHNQPHIYYMHEQSTNTSP